MKPIVPEADSSLMIAAEDGNLPLAKRCLLHGANVDSTTILDPHEGVTPLMLASRHGHDKIVKLLIGAGATIGRKTRCVVPDEVSGETALHWAITAGNKSTCKVLIEAGADVRASSTRGDPLSYAVEMGSMHLSRMLLDTGNCPVGASSGKERRTPIHLAAELGNSKMLMLLIHAGAKPERNPLSHKTPLMSAAVSGSDACVKILIEAGDDLNAIDKNGWTPLMWAAWGGSGRCVKRLIRAGADTSSKQRDGKTALDLAEEVDEPEALYELKKHEERRARRSK